MKKNFKFYVLSWVVLLGLFNLIAFIIPMTPKYTASFWIGWGVTLGAFFAQLLCAWFAFREDSAKKTFYNISLFTISYSALITMFIVAMVFILIPTFPYWIAAIACALVVAINVVAVSKASIAINLVKNVDEKVTTAVAFIYDMRDASESLLARAKDDNAKAICVKVRDAFKFSDPMSKAELVSVENDIEARFNLLKKAIVEGNADASASESEELLALITERNNKCKRLK